VYRPRFAVSALEYNFRALSIRQPVSHTASGLNDRKKCSSVRYSRPQRERAQNVAHIRKQISISITIVQAWNCRNVNKNQIVSSVSAKQNALHIIASLWLVIIHVQKITSCNNLQCVKIVSEILLPFKLVSVRFVIVSLQSHDIIITVTRAGGPHKCLLHSQEVQEEPVLCRTVDRFWDLSNLLSIWLRGLFLLRKAAKVYARPLISI